MHIFDWPDERSLTIKGSEFTVASAHLLSDDQELELVAAEENWQVLLPSSPPDPICSVIKLNISQK
jgi:hypothetical protein